MSPLRKFVRRTPKVERVPNRELILTKLGKAEPYSAMQVYLEKLLNTYRHG